MDDIVAEAMLLRPTEDARSVIELVHLRRIKPPPQLFSKKVICLSQTKLRCLFEVQGQFSFVVFDSSKRRLFAARDASGTEPLYVNTEDDGAMAFTNAPTSSLTDKSDLWQEVRLRLPLRSHYVK